ncbi:hypothetical protein HCH54_008444 [Aspergillus fumigatus]|jgi:hypothetical protein
MHHQPAKDLTTVIAEDSALQLVASQMISLHPMAIILDMQSAPRLSHRTSQSLGE